MNRRDTLKFLAGATAFAGTAGMLGRGIAFAQAKPFTLPPLGYANEALEPHIDAKTMQIHHDNHHAAYVNNLNNNVDKWPEMATKPVEQILGDLELLPEDKRTPVRNNAGGHANHSLFWELMSPDGGGEPTGELASAIESAFGDFESFKTQFGDAGVNRFGSGWAWLVHDGSAISITSTPNQDSPILEGQTPLLGLDVWEHAYYLKYQNRRPDYIAAWWNVVNWSRVAEALSR